MSRRSTRSHTRRTRRTRRRRGGVQPIRIAGIAAGLLAVTGLGVVAGPTAIGRLAPDDSAAAVAAAPMTLAVPDPVVRGVVVDPSGSNGGVRTARADLKELAKLVKTWPGPTPPDDGQAYAGVAGLDLTVRQVAHNSYGAGAEVAHVRIPSVPALPQPPADGTDEELYAQYLDDVDRVLAAHADAMAEAKRAAKLLKAAELSNENSEVAGALSAMIQVLPPSRELRSIVVISDVEQAGATPQVEGDLADIEVTVFQRCDAGAERCNAARESFTALTRKLNGPDPTFLRIETLPDNLTAILKGQ